MYRHHKDEGSVMAERVWSREKLLKWAARLRITVQPGTSDQTLYHWIMAAPATDRQLLELGDLLRSMGRTLPTGMTFGRALAAIHAANDLLNTQALEAMQLEEGQVLEWGDRFLLIMRIYGEQADHKMLVQPVVLDCPQEAERSKPIPIGDEFMVHPKTLYLVSTKVDLTTWRP